MGCVSVKKRHSENKLYAGNSSRRPSRSAYSSLYRSETISTQESIHNVYNLGSEIIGNCHYKPPLIILCTKQASVTTDKSESQRWSQILRRSLLSKRLLKIEQPRIFICWIARSKFSVNWTIRTSLNSMRHIKTIGLSISSWSTAAEENC